MKTYFPRVVTLAMFDGDERVGGVVLDPDSHHDTEKMGQIVQDLLSAARFRREHPEMLRSEGDCES